MNNSLCAKLCQIVSIYAKTVSKCGIVCETVPNNKPNFIFNDWKLFVPNYAKMFWSVQKCAKLYTTVSDIKIIFILTVPICDKSVENVRNLPTWAQFGTVLHS